MTTALASDLISELRTATMPAHEVLDQTIMHTDPFADRNHYARLLTMQYCLQRDLQPLYADNDLAAVLPDLASRSRLALAEQDMADLGQALPIAERSATPVVDGSLAHKLGWLFVLEGSRLGGASLLRRADALGLGAEFGARHFAGDGAPPAEKWRSFVQSVAALSLSEHEKQEAIKGATMAFHHATELARRYVVGDRENA